MGSTRDALELHAVPDRPEPHHTWLHPCGSGLSPARGWRSGLGHMLRWEAARWLHSRQWWVHTLVWSGVINGFPGLGFLLWNVGIPAEEALGALVAFLAIFAPIGVLVIAQGAIVGEKQLGTAAWVLSKPITRSAFVLSKLIVHALAIISIMIVLQGLIGYIQLSLSARAPLPVLPVAAALGLTSLNLLFYLTFTVMLGTLFRRRGPVLGIACGLLLGGPLVLLLLAVIIGDDARWFLLMLPHWLPAIAIGVGGATLPEWWWLTILLTVAYAIASVGVALWRFGREEF